MLRCDALEAFEILRRGVLSLSEDEVSESEPDLERDPLELELEALDVCDSTPRFFLTAKDGGLLPVCTLGDLMASSGLGFGVGVLISLSVSVDS